MENFLEMWLYNSYRKDVIDLYVNGAIMVLLYLFSRYSVAILGQWRLYIWQKLSLCDSIVCLLQSNQLSRDIQWEYQVSVICGTLGRIKTPF